MTASLSLVLPVRNMDRLLTARVSELLDLLTDVDEPFELLIVDDASDDQTPDVAGSLMRAFPQVQLLRLGTYQGWIAAARHGIAHAPSDVVLICNPEGRLSAGEFAELWNLRHDPDLVLARSQPQGPADELLELLAHGSARYPSDGPPMPPGILLVRPGLWQEFLPSSTARPTIAIDRITRTDLRQRRALQPAMARSWLPPSGLVPADAPTPSPLRPLR